MKAPCPLCNNGKFKRRWAKAVRFLVKNKHLWKNRRIEKYHPMSVSLDWLIICSALKHAKIYKASYCPWDMKIEKLVGEAKRKCILEEA